MSAENKEVNNGNVEVIGEVVVVDIRQKQFHLSLDDNTEVTVTFSPGQESDVTKALKDHNVVRLRVKGQGEFSETGVLVRIRHVDEMLLEPAEQRTAPSLKRRRIDEIIAEFGRQVPKEDWDSLPADLSDQVDHYLYGTPKEPRK